MTRRSERRWTLYYPTTRGTLDEMLIDPDVARAMGHHCDGASVTAERAAKLLAAQMNLDAASNVAATRWRIGDEGAATEDIWR